MLVSSKKLLRQNLNGNYADVEGLLGELFPNRNVVLVFPGLGKFLVLFGVLGSLFLMLETNARLAGNTRLL
jgi:hypothetical protein